MLLRQVPTRKLRLLTPHGEDTDGRGAMFLRIVVGHPESHGAPAHSRTPHRKIRRDSEIFTLHVLTAPERVEVGRLWMRAGLQLSAHRGGTYGRIAALIALRRTCASTSDFTCVTE